MRRVSTFIRLKEEYIGRSTPCISFISMQPYVKKNVRIQQSRLIKFTPTIPKKEQTGRDQKQKEYFTTITHGRVSTRKSSQHSCRNEFTMFVLRTRDTNNHVDMRPTHAVPWYVFSMGISRMSHWVGVRCTGRNKSGSTSSLSLQGRSYTGAN